jgi:exodeoxyribonuclease V alpha subunit
MKKHVGKIIRFLFKNPESRFGVAIFALFDNEKRTMVISGNIATIDPGKVIEIEGETVVDTAKNRKTFQVETYKQYVSSNREYLVRYLSSSVFPTIGKSLAEKIVNHYQSAYSKNVIDEIASHPNDLKTIDGATEIKIKIILDVIKSLNDNTVENDFIQNNLNQKFLNQILTKVKDPNEQYLILRNDFYNFAYQNQLVPFSDVDDVALFYGMPLDSEVRISWHAWNIVKEHLVRTGATYMEYAKLKKELQNVFLNIDNIHEKLIYAKQQQILFFKDGEKVYTQESFNDEEYIALTLFNFTNRRQYLEHDLDFAAAIKKVETKINAKISDKFQEYNDDQRKALQEFTQNDFQIVTGGPGTGKTTVISGLVYLFQELYPEVSEKDIAIVAPTGRAASRINESTGFAATTIHRLLKYSGDNIFAVNENNKDYKKMLIVDESSMIDQHLFAELLRGISGLEKIILVGDVDQLPSVGYGNVFDDLIKSGEFVVSRLIKNNRQKDADGNGIIELANAIQNETLDNFDFTAYKKLTVFENAIIDGAICDKIKEIVPENTPESIGKLQVIAPMNAGDYGVQNLNKILQKVYHPAETGGYKRYDYTFHDNDKIICVENNPLKQIYNGDIGIIDKLKIGKKTIETANAIFGGKDVNLSNTDFTAIKLAYACTIHKTQGSEFDNVIVVIDTNNNKNNFMINKKLLYTAITRAKDHLYIFANVAQFKQYAKKPAPIRKTTLSERLKEIARIV